MGRWLVHASVCALLCLASAPARADQFVLWDETYEHSTQTTKMSHYFAKPSSQPASWLSPVDYSQGTAYLRLEVFTKPSAEPTRYQICVGNDVCTAQSPTYTRTGVVSWSSPIPRFYNRFGTNWVPRGVQTIVGIVKDDKNVKPSPEYVPAARVAQYMPTRLRIVVTIVSPGGTYVPPKPTMDGGIAGDAGAGPDAGRDAFGPPPPAPPGPGVDARESGAGPEAASPVVAGPDASAGEAEPAPADPRGARHSSGGATAAGCSMAGHTAGARFAFMALVVGAAAGFRARRSRRR